MKEENNKEDVKILEDEKELVLDHDYDGIRELDHPLPLWWLLTFVGTIAFGFPYWFFYTFAQDAPSIRSQMEEQLAEIKDVQEEYEAQKGGFDVQKFKAFVATEEGKKLGKKTFRRQCAACHGAQGQGSIGPNLTDAYWIHGNGDLTSIYKTVSKGVTSKGMPAWEQSLSEEQLMAVTAYVLKFKGQNVPGKEPQGELIKE